MTSVQIFSIPSQRGGIKYQAVAGQQRAEAETAGQALDAISLKLPRGETSVVVVQPFQEDEFFAAAQSSRMQELMQQWRDCRDTGASLTNVDQAELESLVETELLATTHRAAALASELGR